jgi:hypothetical protein
MINVSNKQDLRQTMNSICGRMQTIDVGAKRKQLPFNFYVYFEGSSPIRRTLGHYVGGGAPQL